MPLYYKDIHYLTEFDIGILLGMNGFVIFLLEMPLIKWLETTNFTKSGLMVFGTILLGISILVLNLTTWTGVLIIGMLFMSLGEMITFPFSNAFALDRAKKGNQGEYMALYSIAFSIAHIFAHNAGMHMVDDLGFDNTWYIFTMLAGFCVLLLFTLSRYLNTQKKKRLA